MGIIYIHFYVDIYVNDISNNYIKAAAFASLRDPEKCETAAKTVREKKIKTQPLLVEDALAGCTRIEI